MDVVAHGLVDADADLPMPTSVWWLRRWVRFGSAAAVALGVAQPASEPRAVWPWALGAACVAVAVAGIRFARALTAQRSWAWRLGVVSDALSGVWAVVAIGLGRGLESLPGVVAVVLMLVGLTGPATRAWFGRQ